MRKLVLAVVILGLIGNGCSWLGFGDKESQATATAPAEDVQNDMSAGAEMSPDSAADKKDKASDSKKSARKGAKTEAQIKAELDQMGKKLVGQSARTLLPNINHKNVSKVGNSWVATYMHVNTQNVSTEMRPSKNGQYVGFIRYTEEVMECRGATKEAALSAPCEKTKTRNLNELIRYDGNQWQD